MYHIINFTLQMCERYPNHVRIMQDIGATTLPNLIRFFTPHVYGPSFGDQFFTFCYGQDLCPDFQYRPSIDYLNAAQSGARSENLDHELDYLLKQLEDAYQENLIQPSDWKLLTIFIGSNDICHSCTTPSALPTSFASNIQKALERIRLNIRNVLVQIGKPWQTWRQQRNTPV